MPAITLSTLKEEIANSPIYKKLDQKQWEEKIAVRGITRRSQKDFDYLIPMYVKKIEAIRQQLAGAIVVQFDEGMTKQQYDEQVAEQTAYLESKAARLLDKLAVCMKEVELRDAGLVTRTEIHDQADYYIDYTNGNDAHDGLSTGNLTVDSTADTTHLTDAALTGVDDYINGDFLWNTTRSAGSLISDFDAASDTAILATPIVGMAAGDTYYILKSWKTITKYTTTEVRTPGDRAFLRANTTWTQGTEAVDITYDEDGTIDSRISIIGCDSVTNDPWNDASDVKPIIDFEDAAYQSLLAGDTYWQFERLDFRQSNDTSGLFYVYSISIGIRCIGCEFKDNAGNGVEGMLIYDRSEAYLEDCTFSDCYGISLQVNQGTVRLKDCTIDAGAVRGSTYGLSVLGSAYIEDCSFAPSNAFGTAEISASSGASIFARNVTFGVSATINAASAGAKIYLEDYDGTFESHYYYCYRGTISRGTTLPHSGGADSYAVMSSNSSCGLYEPLMLGDTLTGFAKIWVATDAASTITVYARVDSAWDSALSAAEAYMKISYLDSAADCGRTIIQSTETISNDLAGDGKGEWTAFTATIPASNPKKDGWVYVWFYLAEYEDAGEYVHVDIKPVVS